jgi:hypothetical protein
LHGTALTDTPLMAYVRLLSDSAALLPPRYSNRPSFVGTMPRSIHRKGKLLRGVFGAREGVGQQESLLRGLLPGLGGSTSKVLHLEEPDFIRLLTLTSSRTSVRLRG